MPKNYGFGRRLDYAGRCVLKAHFGGGHHAARATQAQRWGRFSAWLRAANGIRDMRDIAPAHVRAWADERHASGYAQRTIRDEVSAINVVMGHATRGRWPALSPSALAGPRDDVRRQAPATHAPATDRQARSALAATPRAAAVYAMAHAAGLRAREASLANYARLTREAERYGQINIVDGTKGGRDAARWITVTPEVQQALAQANAARPSANLLRPDETYAQWKNGELRTGRHALHTAGVRGYHDARAAYACQRYQQLTGHAAPAVAGHRAADKQADQAARETIAVELGHGRTQVTASYVGSAR